MTVPFRIRHGSLFDFLSATRIMSVRIPLALQSVFVASNQGEDVHDAPTSAFQVFSNLWSGVRRTRSGRSQRIPRTTSGQSVASFSRLAAAESFKSNSKAKTVKKKKEGPPVTTPQQWLEEYLTARNYRTNRTKAGSTGKTIASGSGNSSRLVFGRIISCKL